MNTDLTDLRGLFLINFRRINNIFKKSAKIRLISGYPRLIFLIFNSRLRLIKMPKQAKYNLQRLLEMRARTRESAIEVLAERRARLAATERELAAREKAVSDCRSAQQTAQSEMLEKSKNGIKNSEIIIHRQHLIDSREREIELIAAVEQQKAVVLCAEKEVEKVLESLTESSRELQTIEKHRENWRRTERIEMTRQEQKTNDEIGAILHERGKFE